MGVRVKQWEWVYSPRQLAAQQWGLLRVCDLYLCVPSNGARCGMGLKCNQKHLAVLVLLLLQWVWPVRPVIAVAPRVIAECGW